MKGIAIITAMKKAITATITRSIANSFLKNEAFQRMYPTAKFTTSRCIVLMEV